MVFLYLIPEMKMAPEYSKHKGVMWRWVFKRKGVSVISIGCSGGHWATS